MTDFDALTAPWFAAQQACIERMSDFWQGGTGNGDAETVSNAGANQAAVTQFMAAAWQDVLKRSQDWLTTMPWPGLGNAQQAGLGQSADAFAQMRALGGDWAASWLAMPNLGPERARLEHMKAWPSLMMDYWGALSEFQAMLRQLWEKTLLRMGTDLQAILAEGEPMPSGEALHKLWVNAGEAVYAEQVVSDRFQSVYGRLVNAMNACKQQQRATLQDWLADLNIPTQQDMNGIFKRIHQNSRTIREIESSLRLCVQGMEADLEDIVAQLDTVKNTLAQLQKTAAPTKRATAKTKTTQPKPTQATATKAKPVAGKRKA